MNPILYLNKKDINTDTFLRNTNMSTIQTDTNNRLTNYGDFTPGRGFGNLHNNNTMRLGENSRNDNKNFSKTLESNINCRFDYLFDNKKQMAFTQNNIIMNQNTRKQQIKSDKIFDHHKFDFSEKQRIETNYFNMVNPSANIKKKITTNFNFNY